MAPEHQRPQNNPLKLPRRPGTARQRYKSWREKGYLLKEMDFDYYKLRLWKALNSMEN